MAARGGGFRGPNCTLLRPKATIFCAGQSLRITTTSLTLSTGSSAKLTSVHLSLCPSVTFSSTPSSAHHLSALHQPSLHLLSSFTNTWKLEPVDALRSILPPPIHCGASAAGRPGFPCTDTFCTALFHSTQSMTPYARNS